MKLCFEGNRERRFRDYLEKCLGGNSGLLGRLDWFLSERVLRWRLFIVDIEDLSDSTTKVLLNIVFGFTEFIEHPKCHF